MLFIRVPKKALSSFQEWAFYHLNTKSTHHMGGNIKHVFYVILIEKMSTPEIIKQPLIKYFIFNDIKHLLVSIYCFEQFEPEDTWNKPEHYVYHVNMSMSMTLLKYGSYHRKSMISCSLNICIPCIIVKGVNNKTVHPYLVSQCSVEASKIYTPMINRMQHAPMFTFIKHILQLT